MHIRITFLNIPRVFLRKCYKWGWVREVDEEDRVESVVVCHGGITSSFVRKVEKTIDMPLDSDVFRVPLGYNAPQQVHITQGDHEGRGVIVSWVTVDEPGSNTVLYWSEKSKRKNRAEGIMVTYKFYNYTSGYIHHCTIKNLEFNTKYYYVVGIGHTPRKFWFVTPPKVGRDVPYTFGLIGDLGQSYDSNMTLTHYELNPAKGKTVLFVGDLSYADRYPNYDNVRWDTWEGSLREVLLINLGYGLQETMRLILLLKLYNSILILLLAGEINISTPNHKNDQISIGRVVSLYPLSLIVIDIMSPTEHQIVPLPSGTLSRGLQHISLSYHHTQHMVSTLILWCTKHMCPYAAE
ncbi:Purple acid phosphatase 2 [Vitis vinifera]|uniref:acid phosphatase n=1 Tax=Vitis vinifera TaxID=29760 RepID=A0A438I944_VITVI|nr:Purple acid phosphatase 2 [Vitis vinifera]